MVQSSLSHTCCVLLHFLVQRLLDCVLCLIGFTKIANDQESCFFVHQDANRVGFRQFIQILINLIQNAIDAMKQSAVRSIEIKAIETETRVELSVKDTGCGIPAENLPKVFDPFFTTKDVGEGMGMGLSVSYRLMHQMRGGIEVVSTPGAGTIFTLWFPLFTPSPDDD